MRSLEEIIRGSFVSLDVEGDGNHPSRPVELSMITVEKGMVVDEAYWLINPGVPITSFVTGLHGISDEDVREAPHFAEIATEVRRRIEGAAIVGHAPKSDLAMLRTGIPDVDFLPSQVIDTQRLAKFLLPDIKRYGLDMIIDTLGLDHDSDGPRSGHHTARHDAVMTARILLDLVPRIPGPKQMTHLTRMATVTLSPHEERRLREMLAALQDAGKIPSIGA